MCRYPDRNDQAAWAKIAQGFAKGGILNAVGALDGTHFLIIEPDKFSIDHPYLDRMRLFSIGAQAVVDADGNFCNFVSGFPGSLHDGTVFLALL